MVCFNKYNAPALHLQPKPAGADGYALLVFDFMTWHEACDWVVANWSAAKPRPVFRLRVPMDAAGTVFAFEDVPHTEADWDALVGFDHHAPDRVYELEPIPNPASADGLLLRNMRAAERYLLTRDYFSGVSPVHALALRLHATSANARELVARLGARVPLPLAKIRAHLEEISAPAARGLPLLPPSPTPPASVDALPRLLTCGPFPVDPADLAQRTARFLDSGDASVFLQTRLLEDLRGEHEGGGTVITRLPFGYTLTSYMRAFSVGCRNESARGSVRLRYGSGGVTSEMLEPRMPVTEGAGALELCKDGAFVHFPGLVVYMAEWCARTLRDVVQQETTRSEGSERERAKAAFLRKLLVGHRVDAAHRYFIDYPQPLKRAQLLVEFGHDAFMDLPLRLLGPDFESYCDVYEFRSARDALKSRLVGAPTPNTPNREEEVGNESS